MTHLRDFATSLQGALAQVDQIARPSRSSNRFPEFLLLKREALKLKIYQEPGHNLPHIHVDYGRIPHAASYGIDPPARLAGKLSNKYDRSVIAWITANKDALLELWKTLQLGGDPDKLAVALNGDA